MSTTRRRARRVLSSLLTFLLLLGLIPSAYAAGPVAIADGAPDAVSTLYGGVASDYFGTDVAYDGDVVAVGVPDASGGRVELYRRSSVGLTLEATIPAPEGGSFGTSVDVSGDTLIVGAPNVASGDGKAYFYTHSAGAWSLETSSPGLPARIWHLGNAVSIEGTTAVIGYSAYASNRGAVRIMSDLGSGWTQTGWIVTSTVDRLGYDVAAGDGFVIAGAPFYNSSSGAVRAYRWDGATWDYRGQNIGSSGGQLGFSVATDGTEIVAGAPYDDTGGANVGYVRTYQLGAGLGRLSEITPSGARDANELFGYSVSVNNGTIAVGARDYLDQGKVTMFVGSGPSWTEVGDFHPTAATTWFGAAVANQSGNVFVGAPRDETIAKYAGAVHEFSSDWFTGTEDTTLTVGAPGVLRNDYDADGDPLEAYLLHDATNGTVTLQTDGSFTYVPDADYEGLDSFVYRTYDGSTYSTPTVASIYLSPVNDAPVFLQSSPTTVTCSEDSTPTPFSLTLDVIDPDVGDTAWWMVSSQASHGTAAVTGYGSSKAITYTPSVNYNGTDSFTVSVNDIAREYAYLTINVVVDPINDAPTFNISGTYNTVEDSGFRTVPNWASSISPGTYSYWTSIAGRPVYVTEAIANEAGQELSANTTNDNPALFTVQPSISVTGTLTFEAVPNAYGTATVSYGITDDATAGAPGSVTTTKTTVINVSPVNDAPVAGPDAYSTDEDQGTVIGAPGILVNDTDVEDASDASYVQPLSVQLETTTAHGALFLFDNGSFIYSPEAGWSGIDSFTYRAWDGGLYSDPATVTIDVGSVNDEPVIAQGGTIGLMTAEDTSVEATLTATDADGDALTWSVVVAPAHGAATASSADATSVVSYDPAPDYNGSDAFAVQASDGNGGTDLIIVQVDVTPENDAPIAGAAQYAATEDTTLAVSAPGLLVSAEDIDGDGLTASLETSPTHGSLELNADGSFTYRPNADYNGPDSFTYRASDAATSSAPATVDITVNPANDAPVSVDAFYELAEENTLVVAAPGVLQGASDIDGDSLDAALVSGTSHGTLDLNDDGGFTYVPEAGWSGVDSFTYRATDGDLSSVTSKVTLTVRSVDTLHTRVEGSSRFLTAISASQLAFPDGADAVVISTAYNWPDALAGSGLAGVVNGPILLTATDALPDATIAEIDRLKATRAYVLGGTGAAAPEVVTALEDMLGAENVVRIGGATRYETSYLVAEETISQLGAAWDGTALIATGRDFPDAIAAAPMSAAAGWPVFLTPSDGVMPWITELLDGLGVQHVVVLGGEGSVPAGAKTELASAGITSERVSGSDRYSTSVSIASYGATHAGLSWSTVGMATGERFPDALAGGITCASRGGVMLLNPTNSVNDAVRSALAEHRTDIEEVLFFGGDAAVSPAVRDIVRNLLR